MFARHQVQCALALAREVDSVFARNDLIIPSVHDLGVRRHLRGGQSGADRATLDWAIAHGIPHDGWCPRGRKTEDGALADRYVLRETPGFGYLQRTEWNVRDSDATLIFTLSDSLDGGSKRTAVFADRLGKPWLRVRPECSRNTWRAF